MSCNCNCNCNTIPSNFTPEEAMGYLNLTPEQEYWFDKLLSEKAELELEDDDTDMDKVVSQLEFCHDFIIKVLEDLKTCGTAEELKKSILKRFEHSYIELVKGD